MYIPSSFAVTDRDQLQDFIERHSFGVLVGQTQEGPVASHLPFLLDRNAGPHGTLIGHLARANRHWQHFGTSESLVVFNGPHAYISPTWYQTELTVPTWNYIAVHAYGRAVLIEDPAEMLVIVNDMVTTYERSMPQPWSMNAPQEFVDKLLQQIVGFRIEITRLEGKWKLNQNHPQERRERVMRELNERGDENSLAIAAAIQSTAGLP